MRLAIVLETATTLGALTGVFLIGMVSTAFLYGLFTLILLVSARQMLARRREQLQAGDALHRAGRRRCACMAALPTGCWAVR